MPCPFRHGRVPFPDIDPGGGEGTGRLFCFSGEYEDDQYERYHKTVGCAFDQQMAWENHRNILTAAALGKAGRLEETLRRQLPLLDPVQVGKSGQVKEYREE